MVIPHLCLLSALEVRVCFADQVEVLVIKDLLLFAFGSPALLALASALVGVFGIVFFVLVDDEPLANLQQAVVSAGDQGAQAIAAIYGSPPSEPPPRHRRRRPPRWNHLALDAARACEARLRHPHRLRPQQRTRHLPHRRARRGRRSGLALRCSWWPSLRVPSLSAELNQLPETSRCGQCDS